MIGFGDASLRKMMRLAVRSGATTLKPACTMLDWRAPALAS
jgi:hypothetical protein